MGYISPCAQIKDRQNCQSHKMKSSFSAVDCFYRVFFRRARNSFGALLCTDSASFMLKQFVEQIRFLENQIDELDEIISESLAEINSLITTITDIGDTLVAAILSEIGDIERFESADKLAAFAGIDPSVSQSGNFLGTKSRMAKRGSPYLRRAI